MASSDEDDVCVGPLTLNDLRKALNIMDPFRKIVTTDAKNVANIAKMEKEKNVATNLYPRQGIADVLITEMDDTCDKFDSNDSAYNIQDANNSEGSDYIEQTLSELEKTIEDSILEDPLALSFDIPPSENSIKNASSNSINSYEEEFENKCVIKEDSIILNEYLQSSISVSTSSEALKSSANNNPRSEYNDTNNWVGLVNNITNRHNIFDQTEPEHLLQHTMENTIVPEIRIFKKNKFDLTIIEQPEWQNESLSSFEAMEYMTSSPTKIITKPLVKVDPEDIRPSSSEVSCITSAYETAQQSSFETSTDSQVAKDNFFTAQNTSVDSESTKASLEINSSQDFENTFEEMQYYLDLDTKLKENSKLNTPEHTKPMLGCPYPKFSPVTPTSDSASLPASPLSARRPKRKDFYPKPSPLQSLHLNSEFRMPKSPSTTSTKTLSKSPLYNYQHIVSPISIYIKNTPKVPLLGSHTPGKNAGLIKNKIPMRDIIKNEKSKENIDTGTPHSLPHKAYKSSIYSTTTTINSPCVLSSLSKNDKIKKLISNTPAHKVIRHEGRIKESKLPRLKITKPEDSFANLSVSSADLSVLVKKEVARTETIFKKKL